ncbi:MAG: helix-turn-helix domain-containing protein [Steroidobacteraceae bacterium]|jgi:transcriptional regulator with XRE-family HTH domain|nr:helix-turn-helix domain-containing protein [Steroidobacteraceae bacterium]
MPRNVSPLLPATQRRLAELGHRLRLARLRRGLSAEHVAERAGMARKTLAAVERGAPGATMGAYAAVLQVLQLDAGLDGLAADDALGRMLQDTVGLPARARRRAPSNPPGSPLEPPLPAASGAGADEGPASADPGSLSTDALLDVLRKPPGT